MPHESFSHSCWTLIIPNLRASLAFPVQWNCTDWRDSSKIAIISMQDSQLPQKKSHSLFLCSSHLHSSTTYQNKAVLINNILMEKIYNLYLSSFLCMAFTSIQFNKSSEERDKKTSTYKHHSLLSPQHFLLIKSAMKKTAEMEVSRSK